MSILVLWVTPFDNFKFIYRVIIKFLFSVISFIFLLLNCIHAQREKLTIFVPDSSLQIRTGCKRRETPPPPPRLLMPLESSKRQERSIGNLSRKGFLLAAILFIIIYWITYTSRTISAKDISCHRSFIDNESCLFILNS